MHGIAIQSAIWFDWNDPLASLTYIRKLGFDAVDLNINGLCTVGELKKQQTLESVLDVSDEALAAHFAPLCEATRRTGVAICQMHAPFPLYLEENPALTEFARRMTEQCIKVCAMVGCPFIVVHPISLADAAREWEINLEMYRRFVPAARKYGVKICLENLFKRWGGRIIEGCCADAEAAVRYIDTLNAEAGEELFGFCFDIGHANLVGRNLRRYVEILGKRLTVLHLHDNNGLDDQHLIPYTCQNGHANVCDWEGFLEGLRTVGYEGEICFETFHGLDIMPREARDQVLSLIAAIGRHFKEKLEETRA